MFFILDVGIGIAIAPLGGRSLWTFTITISDTRVGWWPGYGTEGSLGRGCGCPSCGFNSFPFLSSNSQTFVCLASGQVVGRQSETGQRTGCPILVDSCATRATVESASGTELGCWRKNNLWIYLKPISDSVLWSVTTRKLCPNRKTKVTMS